MGSPSFWSFDEYNHALEREYERPSRVARYPIPAGIALSIADQRGIPIDDIYSGRSRAAVDARRSLCGQLEAQGWTPWHIAERLAMPWDVVVEACSEDVPVSTLEYQGTLTKRRVRPWARHLRTMGRRGPVSAKAAESVLRRVGLRLVEPYDAGHRGNGPQTVYHGAKDLAVGGEFAARMSNAVCSITPLTPEQMARMFDDGGEQEVSGGPRIVVDYNASRGAPVTVCGVTYMHPADTKALDNEPDLSRPGQGWKSQQRPYVVDAELPPRHRSKPLAVSVQDRAATKLRKAKVAE